MENFSGGMDSYLIIIEAKDQVDAFEKLNTFEDDEYFFYYSSYGNVGDYYGYASDKIDEIKKHIIKHNINPSLLNRHFYLIFIMVSF